MIKDKKVVVIEKGKKEEEEEMRRHEILVPKTPTKEETIKEVIDLKYDKDPNKMIGKKTLRNSYDNSNEEELKVINVGDDITIKLIANNYGVFVDVRKYYKGYPTKKGIRILATRFNDVAFLLHDDIEKYVPKQSDLKDLNKII